LLITSFTHKHYQLSIIHYPLYKRPLPYVIFVTLLIVYANYYYDRLFPSDAVSYISIAEKYAAGNFGTAVNAYWSPMISWLMALQIKLGVPAIQAFHIIKIISGLLLIFFAEKIIHQYNWPNWAQVACSIIVSAWAAYFTLHFLSPDALMTAGLLLYLHLVLSGKWLQQPLITGLLGAALYFTKAFGFYFFAAHLLLYIFWKLLSDKKQFLYIIQNWLIAFSVFIAASGVWMIALHHRYGKWMISSAGSYNHGLMQYGDGSVQPVLRSGLLPLPDSSAYHPWEEITLVHTYTDWWPWQSQDYFLLQLKVIRNNGWYMLQHMYGANRLAWPALLAGLLVIIFFAYKKIVKQSNVSVLRKIAHTSVFVLLYCFGYAVAGVDERYLFIVNIGLLFILFETLGLFSKKYKLPDIVLYITASLLVVQCLFEVIGKLNFFKNELQSQMEEVENLKQIVPPQSIVATHQTNTINALDYLGQWHNHGGLQAYQNKDSALLALRKYGVAWVLIPDSVKQQYTWLANYSDSIAEVKNWRVYKLRNKYMQ
jgi:hypothetical protein